MIWDAFMFNGEIDMLECRLEELDGLVDRHVLVESRVTHLGYPKPLYFPGIMAETCRHHPVSYVEAKELPVGGPAGVSPWQREHGQRDAAWTVLRDAYDEDWVLICDADEIPSADLIRRLRSCEGEVVSIDMRTCIFAVDWEADSELPPTCVAARVGFIRGAGGRLSAVRDARGSWPRLSGGWHLSWLGGPMAQAAKLQTASCHVDEIMATPEGQLILSGARYRTSESGGGLPVRPVDVDGSWPAYVYERRCPESWFRPR